MKKEEILTLLTASSIDDIAGRWGASGEEVKFVRAWENFIYEINSPDRSVILRLTHSSHRSSDEVAAELEFVEFLGANGVSVAIVVPSRHGHLVETLKLDDSYFSAAVFEMAPGSKPAFDPSGASQNTLYQDWGNLMGSIHRLVPEYRGGGGDPRRHVGIADQIISKAADILPSHAQHVLPVLYELIEEISRFAKTPDNYGLLHTDLHHGNFHVDGRRLTLFDFDDCCHHWFAYDLAVPVWHYPLKDRRQDPSRDRAILTQFLQEFIRGYQQVSTFQRQWLEQMPLFFRLRDLQLFIFAWKMWDWVNPEPWQHDFMKKRLALIVTHRASVEVDWDALSI